MQILQVSVGGSAKPLKLQGFSGQLVDKVFVYKLAEVEKVR